MGYLKENEFTLEFNEVIEYMTSTLFNEFPTDVLTLEYLILSILDKKNCHANMILDNCLMSNNIEELRKIYVSVLEKHIKPQLKTNNIIFNDDLVKAIECSKAEADKLNTRPIGTEHILLAILNKENNFRESEVFNKFRLEYEFILNKCSAPKETNEKTKNEKLKTKKINKKENIDIPLKSQINTKTISTNEKNDFINDYTTSLNKLAREGKIDEIVGRKQEIEEIIKVLCRRKKNNAVLVGEGGCGKTAIIYGIANLIENGNVPDVLDGKEIIMLNPMALVSGTHFRGMFEERINGLFNEIKRKDKYILFIDDIHTVLKSGSKEKDADISGMIGEALSEGSIRIIGTTTFKEYRNSIESNSSLSRKLQKIIIEPTTINETIKILNTNKRYYEDYHNVIYTNKAVEKAVYLADRYITDRSLPDSAFDIIDLAGANTSLIDREPIEIQNIKKRIREIEDEKNKALNSGDFEKIDSLNAENNVLLSDLADYKRNSNKDDVKAITIDENDISNVVSEITKIPVSKLSSSEKSKIAHIDEILKQSIIGQDEAITAICKTIKKNKVGLSDSTHCNGVFLLCGKTGTGKTLLAKKLAEELFGTEKALIRIDMSEYSEKNSISKLHGCFTPESLILMGDGSYKEISEVNVGEKVITPNGNIKEVKNKFVYDIDEEIDVYSSHCFGIPLRCTKGHNILTITPTYYNKRIDKSSYCKENAKFLKSEEIGENNIFLYPKSINYLSNENVVYDLIDFSNNITNVKSDDEKIWFFNNIKINRFIRLNEKLARLLGYYVSEGGVSKNFKKTTFSFHSKETDYQNEVIELIQDIFGLSSSVNYRKNKNVCNITVHSKFVGNFIASLCGRECHIKKIPIDIMRSSKIIQHNFLETAIYGDGTKTIKNKISYTSASIYLASQINTMFRNCGYSTQFTRIKCKSSMPHYNYRIIITGNNVLRLNENIPSSSLNVEEVKPKGIQRFQYVDNDYYYYQIKNKSQEQYKGKVYDLTIEDDSSYVVNGISVHNSSPGYVGYDDGGILTNSIKQKPYSVVLLDEIEKADDSIYNLFLQIFDDGRITESNGNVVDCHNCTFIMTSNIGARKAAELGNGLGFVNNEEINKKSIIDKELKKKFTPEFINRIDQIVYFNNLTDDNLRNIVKLEINKFVSRLKDIEYNIEYSDDVVNYIHAEAIKEKEFGARPINRIIQTNIEDKVTELMLGHDYEPNYVFHAFCDNGEIVIE